MFEWSWSDVDPWLFRLAALAVILAAVKLDRELERIRKSVELSNEHVFELRMRLAPPERDY